MAYTYVEFEFENADGQRTENIVKDLMNAGIGYEHITGQAGYLVGCIHKELDFETFKDKALNIVWDHTAGCHSQVRTRTYKQIEHLL